MTTESFKVLHGIGSIYIKDLIKNYIKFHFQLNVFRH